MQCGTNTLALLKQVGTASYPVIDLSFHEVLNLLANDLLEHGATVDLGWWRRYNSPTPNLYHTLVTASCANDSFEILLDEEMSARVREEGGLHPRMFVQGHVPMNRIQERVVPLLGNEEGNTGRVHTSIFAARYYVMM